MKSFGIFGLILCYGVALFLCVSLIIIGLNDAFEPEEVEIKAHLDMEFNIPITKH